jgi:hypothetical protein
MDVIDLTMIKTLMKWHSSIHYETQASEKAGKVAGAKCRKPTPSALSVDSFHRPPNGQRITGQKIRKIRMASRTSQSDADSTRRAKGRWSGMGESAR